MYIAIGAMILVLVGMLAAKNRMANSPMLQPLLFLCVMVELGLVVYVLYDQFSKSGQGKIAANQELRERAKGFVAGKFLAGNAETRGKKLLIVNDAGSGNSRYARAFGDALKAQYGPLIEDEVGAATEGEIIPLKAKDVAEVLARHPDVQVVVFRDTLPEDYGELKLDRMFIVNAGGADLRQIRDDIRGGRIVGGIFGIRGVRTRSTDKVEKDPEEAFRKRYILIDRNSLEANAALFD